MESVIYMSFLKRRQNPSPGGVPMSCPSGQSKNVALKYCTITIAAQACPQLKRQRYANPMRPHKIDSMFYLRNFWGSYVRARKNNTNSKNAT